MIKEYDPDFLPVSRAKEYDEAELIIAREEQAAIEARRKTKEEKRAANKAKYAAEREIIRTERAAERAVTVELQRTARKEAKDWIRSEKARLAKANEILAEVNNLLAKKRSK